MNTTTKTAAELVKGDRVVMHLWPETSPRGYTVREIRHNATDGYVYVAFCGRRTRYLPGASVQVEIK